MRFQRPHIQLATQGHIMSQDVMSLKGDIVAVIWAPPFEGPLSVPEELVEPYYEAYHTFANLLQTSKLKVNWLFHWFVNFAFSVVIYVSQAQ